MKTAEEFIKQTLNIPKYESDISQYCTPGDIYSSMREFAKMHVQEALKQASENATVTPIDHEEISEGSFRPIWGVDDESILNAYPLENIK